MSYLRLLAAVGLLSACDDLNDTTYVGDERYDVEGVIESLATGATGARTYAALSWFTDRIDSAPSAHVIGEVGPVQFPAPFALSIYALPGDKEWLVSDTAQMPPVGVVGFGNILVFDDVDGDGQYHERRDVVRGRTETTVVYARELSARIRSRIADRGWLTNPDQLQPGFQIGTMHADRTVTLADDQGLRRRVVITTPPADPEWPECPSGTDC